MKDELATGEIATANAWVQLYGKPPLTLDEATPAIRYACGLRELADWIEAHPEVQLPEASVAVYAEDRKEIAAKIMRALSPCEKDYDGDMFHLKRKFGPIELRFVFLRDAVCTPRVVGKRMVKEHIRPGIPERVIPAHEENVVEWDCEPTLGETE